MNAPSWFDFADSLAPIVLLAVIASVGCDLSTEPIGGVKGKVTIDGQPASDGTIAFVPLGQKYPSARGNIAAGQYQQSVPSGAYKVMISSQRVIGETRIYNSPDSPTRKTTEEILPARYNDQTELQIDVGAEITEYNFDLSSK